MRKEYIRRKNDKSIRNGYISDGLSSNFGNEYDDSWDGYFRQKSEEKLSANQGQPTNKQARFSKSNGDRGRGRLRLSLKDSDEIRFSKETIDNNSGNGVDINEDLGQDLSEKEKSTAERAGATEVVTSPTDNASSLDSIHNTNENVNTSHERRKQITI